MFYIDLLYTRARSGILGIWIALLFLGITHIFIETRNKKHETRNTKQFIARYLLPAACLLLLVTFVIGTPFTQLQKFSLAGIGSYFQKAQTSKNPPASASIPTQPVNSGGTESADIRLLVWEGAINAWKENPIFGSGVETFAYVYYKYKPVGQNLTSEWNFLYNKAHNEYLNYLATTGIFGLGTYLGMIIVFLWIALTKITNTFANFAKKFESVREKYEPTSPQNSILILALIAGYLSILVTNFFGFSVVIVNIYLFMIPAFVLVLSGMITKNESGIPTSLKFQGASKNQESRENKTSIYQWTAISFIILASLFMILNLFRFWQADIAYALGYNLDRAGEYQRAYPFLHKAVSIRGDEPVFKDELSINDAIIAASLFSQEKNDKETMSVASQLIQEAVNTSNEIVSQNQNNPVFWKTRVRLFYTLSQVDSRYLPRALDSIAKASLLAPNDANISYNLGVLYGQNNDIKKGVEVLEKTVEMKPDYKDAHYALGLFYRTLATDEKGKVVIDPDMQKKAVEQMQYILDYLSPNDPAALDSIKSWGE